MSNSHIRPCSTALDVVDRLFVHTVTVCKHSDSLIGRTNLKYLLFGQFRESGSLNVLGVCDYLKMVWTNARGLSAKMIDLHPRWNGSDLLFVHSTVGANYHSSNRNLLVSPSIVRTTCAYPAGGRESTVFLRPHVRSDYKPSQRKSAVGAPVSDMLAPGVPKLTIALHSTGCNSPTSTHAESRWIRWRNVRGALAVSPMAVKVWPRCALSSSRSLDVTLVDASILTATTFTQHVVTLAVQVEDRN